MNAAPTFESLPLYASDEAIGAAVLGPARAKEWCSLALALELQGLPPVDHLHRGRYTPGVRRFYALRNGETDRRMAVVDGAENMGAWASKRSRRA